MEAKNLPNLLKRVANHKDIEIIVMDDDSTDQTCAIAEQYGAHVYKVSKHATWKGKSHACWEGSQFASHNMLLFVDADVQFSRLDSIWQIVNQYKLQQYRGLLSIQPYHMIERLYENASALFNVMTIVGMNTFSITKSKYDDQMAFGPVILTNKQDYELTQGHFNAKDSIIEGFAISKSYHQHALPVELYEGQGVVNFRMYPQGYKSLIEGWSKHIALGAQVTEAINIGFNRIVVNWYCDFNNNGYNIVMVKSYIYRISFNGVCFICLSTLCYFKENWEFSYLSERLSSIDVHEFYDDIYEIMV
ncbi:glycosyltransferase family 2 protein [Mammaliicoccus sciuri]|nr:glycosyltransferase family 2 protein [Mammaliicoccus sciuri]